MQPTSELRTSTACLSHSNKHKPQISKRKRSEMSINLLNVESLSEKLWHILRSHKIRSTFYPESALRKPFCKPKVRVATEDKNNIVYEIYCSNCEAVCFGESRQSLRSGSDEHKISVRNYDCEKNAIAKHSGSRSQP